MSRRVYLHVGAPKTGTTYLQDRLTLNADSLAGHGVHFPTRSPLVSPAARSSSARPSTCSAASGARRRATPPAAGRRWSSGYAAAPVPS